MKIGLYKRQLADEALEQLSLLVKVLQANDIETLDLGVDSQPACVKGCDFVFSVGGDGTLLSTVHLIGDSGVPVVGLNFGHLGFLTTVGKADIQQFVGDLLQGNYSVEERTLLHVEYPSLPQHNSYALNEVNVHRRDNCSLLSTRLYVNDEYVSTYVADGLIVATPTGSTAYSLSCGGPILTPDCGCFVITPIGAHTLTLRPIIVPDTAAIRLVSDARNAEFIVSMDSRSLTIPIGTEIRLCREPFTLRLVRMNNQTFFDAIHEKLSWGC